MVLVVTMILSLLPVTAFSATGGPSSGTTETFTVEDEEFVFEEPGKADDAPVGDIIITDKAYRIQKNPDLKSYTILEYLGSASNVVIPAEYDGLPITRIGAYAFQGKRNMVTVSIPETVTRMEEGVFDGCTGLAYHSYDGGKYLGSAGNPYYYYWGPEDVSVVDATIHRDTRIVAALAFQGCDMLQSVIVPDGVIQIGYGMLSGCQVQRVTLPFVGELGTDGNTQFGWIFGARTIGGNISYVPQSLKTVMITGGDRIAQGAFYGVDMLQSITLPYLGGNNGNKTNAFLTYYWGADSHAGNILPQGLENVTILGGAYGYYAFDNCPGLESVTLHGITELPSGLFQDCAGLNSVTLPDTVTTIGDGAFAGCTGLKSLTLPSDVYAIGGGAFADCTGLENITLPDGVICISSNAFRNCTSLKSITLPTGLTELGQGVFRGCESLTEITIPDGITYLDSYLFEKCSNLKTVNLPKGLTSVGTRAFQSCTALTGISLPDSVNAVGSYAFEGCTNLTNVTLPSGITRIEEYTFCNCTGLTGMTLPGSMIYIGNSAFSGCSGLTDIEIPAGVTSIEGSTFSGCTSLTDVTLPDSVTAIKGWAFEDCGSLARINLSDAVTSIGSSAFSGCSSLTSLTIPAGLTTISNSAFAGCGFSTITIPASVTALGQYAFSGCLNLRQITVGPNITAIGDYAFRGCAALTSITLSEGLTTIGSNAFKDCSGLTSITIPSTVTSIGSSAFSSCTRLFEVINNSNLTFTLRSSGNGYVAYYAKVLYDKNGTPTYASGESGFAFMDANSFRFMKLNGVYTMIAYMGTENTVTLPLTFQGNPYDISYLRGVRHVIVPKGITTLSSTAFCDCTSLQSVTLPEGLTSIGSLAFSGCTNLEKVTLPSTLKTIGNSAFYNCTSLKEIALPKGVTTLERHLFWHCTSLKEIAIPSGVTSIGNSVFEGCTGLTQISLPAGLTSIGNSAFYACDGLTEITIPAGVTSLGTSAFPGKIQLRLAQGNSSFQIIDGILYDKPVTKILFVTDMLPENLVIPSGVTTIGNTTFQNRSSLKRITLPAGLTSIGTSAFADCPNLTTVTLPASLTKINAWAFSKCGSLESISIPDTVTSIGASVFRDCTGLTEVTLSTGLTSIPEYAFYGCTSLEEIDIPAGVTLLYRYCFENCSSLKRITLPAGLTTFDNYVFQNCPRLTDITLPEGLTSIGSGVFSKCTGLTDITIPSSVTTIHSNAFKGCTGLVTVTLPESLTSVGYGVFQNCTGLAQVKLPDSITTIDSYAFNGCTGLTSITLPGNLSSIGSSAFHGCTRLYEIINHSSLSLVPGNSGSGYVAYYAHVVRTGQGDTYRKGQEGFAYYDTDDGFRFLLQNGTYWLMAYLGTEETVVLPVDVQGNPYNIDLIRGVRKLIVPEGISHINAGAFRYCNCLTSVQILGSDTTIDQIAFSGCTNLTEVQFSRGAIIRSKAFENCTTLERIDLTGVRQLDSDAFSGCTNLTDVRYDGEQNEWRHVTKATTWNAGMPEFQLTFKENAGVLYETDEQFSQFYISGFAGQGNEVAPPAYYSGRPVTAVLSGAFRGNGDIVRVTLPETLTHIGEYAFVNCSALEYIQFPESLQTIQRGVISGCDALRTLVLPFLGRQKAVDETSYLGYVFGAYSYKENGIYLPQGLTAVTVTDAQTIGSHAFDGCAWLKNVTLTDTVSSIGDYAFYSCSGLETMVLPDSVTHVGKMPFARCQNLSAITLGAGLGYDGIDDLALGNPLFGIDKSASRLRAYIVAEGNPDFAADRGILYRTMPIDGVALPVEVVDAPVQANLLNYALPELIVKIGSYAFAYNNTLRAIDLEYVRMIGKNAFYKAENLIYANFGTPSQPAALPEGVDAISYSQYVGEEAFMGCTALQHVNLDSRMLIGIGASAFADCDRLTAIFLGKTIREVGLNAFGTSGSGGSALEQIQVAADNPCLQSIDGVLYRRNADGTLTLLIYPALSEAFTVVDGKNVFYVPADKVTAIESYAFRMAQKLNAVHVQPEKPTRIGDYAFAGSRLERVFIGENITSLGLRRGESEYTVFADCNYLVAIEVEEGNAHYASQDGVLFDHARTRLIKYPAAKAGALYELPATVGTIASMAFKGNTNLKYVRIPSYINTVGLEAFYGCTSLSLIFFDKVYAPVSVLENAFTTFDSMDQSHLSNPRTRIGYSSGYYLDGADGYGWSNYEDAYSLVLCEALPESENRGGNEFYAVVVVDSEGRRIDRVNVTLTDPNGLSETVATGAEGAATGVAMFYDLFDAAGMGFALNFEGTYALKVSDPEGEYFTYGNPSFYLDEQMRITYVTLSTIPAIYGTTCGEVDINTESAEINKAEYGYSNVELIDESLGFVEGNIKETSVISESIDISIIAYCDSNSGWRYVDESGKLLDADAGLYQNGIRICQVSALEIREDSVLLTFSADISKLTPEVPVEARLNAYDAGDTSFLCATVLNIHIFDFVVTEDDVNLDAQELEIDLANQNQILAKLFGSDKLDVSFGKNVSFGVSVDGSRVEMTLGAEHSKSMDKTSVGVYSSYKEGYEKNHGSHNKNTYFFQFTGTYTDQKGKEHLLTYNVRFARGTEESNYFFYRCYVYEGKYSNEVATFYGAVNGLNDIMSKAVGAKTYREKVAPKAFMIYKCHLATANHSAKKVKDIADLDGSAQYIEALNQNPSVTNSHSFDVKLSGKLIFEYDREAGLKPVSSEIHGELYYTFKHNSQFVVWVIPVVMEVEVKVGGEVDITLRFDESRKVSLEEAKLKLTATISAQVGVGCSVASLGIYGSIGTVFVLDFYPELGVDSWTLNGELGAYMKILWYTKKFEIAKFENVSLLNSQMTSQVSLNAMYLAENYSSENLDHCDGGARIISAGSNIYKVFYVDASGLEGYDVHNYRKLAVAIWQGSDWSEPVLVDNNGKNDAAFDVYVREGKTYLVYTQQAKVLDASAVDDPYVSSADMIVKTADISDIANVTVSGVAGSAYYKYLATVAEVDGTLTAVWAENADNDMFGVSPYNYIDASGTAHVFQTTANAIYMSKLVNGLWQTPVCIQSGLSAVTDIAVAEDGSICYIVDTNGDLGDTEDRVMYSVSANGKTISPVNDTENGSITGVEALGTGYVYYFSSHTQSGLYAFSLEDGVSVDLPDGALPEDYQLIQDASGAVTAIFYTAIKTWDEDGKTQDGSAMYALFRNGDTWGLPVEINAFPVQAGVYIASFDAIIKDCSAMLVADFVDRDGQLLYQLTEPAYSLAPELEIQSYEVDYVKQLLNVTIANTGAQTATIYASVGDSPRNTYGDGLLSGDVAVISISLSGCGVSNPVVKIYDSADGASVYEISDVDLNYSDMTPLVKQLLLGENNNLLLAVKNTGNLANTGYVIVRPGNYDTTTIDAQTLLELTNATALEVDRLVSAKDSQGNPFWVVSVACEPGAVHYYEIPLTDQVLAEEGLITVYLHAGLSHEKGTAAHNNITYLAYQACVGVLAEGETVTAVPELKTDCVEFDTTLQDSIYIDFSCGAADSLLSVALEDGPQLEYDVQLRDGQGTLTLPGSGFSSAGTYSLVLTFAEGGTCGITVIVPQYHTITWVADGQILCTTRFKQGTIPYMATAPVREGSTFAGWATSPDAATAGIGAAVSDTTYYALWREEADSCQVTWIFQGSDGQQITVAEYYAPNALPAYNGRIPTPDGKKFAGWDKEIGVCVEDVVYTAVYESLAKPTLTLRYPTLAFRSEIRYNIYFSAQNIDEVVEMGLITFAASLPDGTITEAAEVIPGYVSDSNGYMAHSNGIPARKLGDTLFFKVYAKLSDGSYVYSTMAGYHAIKYAETVLNNAGSTEEAKTLMVAMLNYGAAAQEYFGYKTDSLMNAGLTAQQQAMVKGYSSDMITTAFSRVTDKVGTFTATGGFSTFYPKVSFEGAFAINYYCVPQNAVDGTVTLYYWDVQTYESSTKLTAENAAGCLVMAPNSKGEYSATSPGIAAKNLDDYLYVSAVYESNGTTYCSGVIAYSLTAYCKGFAENDASPMQKFSQATVVYGYYAKELLS